MTEYQIQAMARAGEHGEPIFRDSPRSGSRCGWGIRLHREIDAAESVLRANGVYFARETIFKIVTAIAAAGEAA